MYSSSFLLLVLMISPWSVPSFCFSFLSQRLPEGRKAKNRNKQNPLSIAVIGTVILCSANPTLAQFKSKPTADINPSFALFELNDDFNIREKEEIGEVEIKDVHLNANCTYHTIKNLAIKEARILGGNCLKIISHKSPDRKNSCHRIKAKVYKISNPQNYEKKIEWNENRKLRIIDFKASSMRRSAQALTNSSNGYEYYRSGKIQRTSLTVKTIFITDKSFFKHSKYDSLVLKHEQLHFDISEIYARKFIKKIVNDIHSFKKFQSSVDRIFNRIMEELDKKQQEYDREIYSDRSQQDKWCKWVTQELQSLDNYKNKTLSIDF